MKQARAVLAAIAVLAFSAAARAATDEVAVIVNKSNPVVGLTIVQLRAILLERTTWTGGGSIRVVMTPAGQPERSGTLRIVCGMTETDFNMHFIHLSPGWRNSDGSVNRENREHVTVLGTGVLVRQSVATTPNALGFIKASEVDPSIKVVAVDGSSPGQAAYKLKLR